MAHIASRDYRRLLDLAVAVVDGLATDSYESVIAGQLNDCLRGTATLFMNGFRPATGAISSVAWAPDEVGTIPWEARARDYGAAHPLAHAFADRRYPGPLTVSDVVDRPAWQASPTYASCDQDLDGGTRHLAIPLPTPAGVATAFIVCRSGRDFTDRERALAEQVQPLLVAVNKHVAEVQRLRRALAASARPGRPAVTPADLNLTPRELAVLGLSAQGLTAATMARRLGVSGHTVNKHLENAYRKCGTHDRVTTVLLLRDLGLLPVGPDRDPAD